MSAVEQSRGNALRRLMWGDTDLSELVRADVLEYMRANGVTQAELARRMGVSSGRASTILHGREALLLSTVDRVAAALGVDVEFKIFDRP